MQLNPQHASGEADENCYFFVAILQSYCYGKGVNRNV